jgi:hypothetical protein
MVILAGGLLLLQPLLHCCQAWNHRLMMLAVYGWASGAQADLQWPPKLQLMPQLPLHHCCCLLVLRETAP